MVFSRSWRLEHIVVRDPHEETAVIAGVCLFSVFGLAMFFFWSNPQYIVPALVSGWTAMFTLFTIAALVQWRLARQAQRKQSESV